MCGWLKKLRKVKMVGQMRWVVLDGSKLMYYEDRAVSAQHQHATYDLECSYSPVTLALGCRPRRKRG